MTTGHDGIPSARTIAVVGTGTGVGKTVAARRLRDELRRLGEMAVCLKPWVSGRRADGTWEDLERLECAPLATFERPAAPWAAVRAGETPADPETVLDGVRAMERAARQAAPESWILVEGIGGVLVPLAPGVTWRDWHAEARWPAIVVGAAGLGTINHSLLTIEALTSRAIPILGVLLSETAPEPPETAVANLELIAELGHVVPLGVLRYDAARPGGGAWEGPGSVGWRDRLG